MEEINLKELAEGKTPSQVLNELIDKIEADAVELRKFTITDTDNMVLLGKINEVVAYLKKLMPQLDGISEESRQALEKAQTALDELDKVMETATNALEQANSANDTAGDALEEVDDAMQRLDKVEADIGTLTSEDGTLAERVTACENVNAQQTIDIENIRAKANFNSVSIADMQNINNAQDKEIAKNADNIASIINTGLDTSTLDIIKKANELQSYIKNETFLTRSNSGWQSTATQNQARFGIDGKKLDTGGSTSNACTFNIQDDTGSLNVTPSGDTLFLNVNGQNTMNRIAEKGKKYVKFVNGLIIQWGNITPAKAGTNVTLPIPFSVPDYCVSASNTTISSNQIKAFAVTQRQTSYFKCYGQYSQSNSGLTGGDVPFCWIAIGY